MMLKPYPAYKDSGVEWLGKLPEVWGVKQLKRIARLNPSKTEVPCALRTGHATFLPMERVGDDGTFDASEIRPVKDLWNGFTYFRKGDVIVAKITPSFENGKGASLETLPTTLGFGSTEFHVLRPSKLILPKYLYLLTVHSEFRRLGADHMTGAAGQQRVPADFIANFPVPLPPLSEQYAIVKFLDWADRRIKLIIAARKKRIRLLEEYRQTLINDAVTGKFDVRTGKPYPAYKDSGVEWLGKVPEGWGVKKLRQVTELVVSNVDKKSSSDEVPVRLCNYADVYNNYVITEELTFMQATASKEEIRKYAIKRGDVAITKDSEIWNDIGVPAYVDYEAPDLIYGYHLVILRPSVGTLDGKYLFRTLQSQAVATQLHIEATGVTRFGLSQQAIKSVRIPLPLLPEQRAIAEYLDRETKKIDAAIEKTQKSIELWEELRTTLISNVVTGKLDVREVAEKLPEREPELEAKIEAIEASLRGGEVEAAKSVAEEEAEAVEETA